MKAGGRPVLEVLQKLFNSVLHGGITPEAITVSSPSLPSSNSPMIFQRNLSISSSSSRIFSSVVRVRPF
ncbi:unnamed protein product [Parnassius mnemosyne]|uniref:Uncharacterized protein n=1 Tax=Parnassius mnemosyne TaxID=213953 RepID=A0AAV1LMJ2_9NEOP